MPVTALCAIFHNVDMFLLHPTPPPPTPATSAMENVIPDVSDGLCCAMENVIPDVPDGLC